MHWNLFLDDIRFPDVNKTWEIARSVKEALSLIDEKGCCPIFISFDHDLGENVPTGYDFAKMLIEMDLNNPGFIPDDFDYFVHSANPVGARNIRSILERYLKFRKNE